MWADYRAVRLIQTVTVTVTADHSSQLSRCLASGATHDPDSLPLPLPFPLPDLGAAIEGPGTVTPAEVDFAGRS